MKNRMIAVLFVLLLIGLTNLYWPETYASRLALPFKKTDNSGLVINKLSINKHYTLSVYADNVPGVRTMVVTDHGDLIITQSNSGTLSLILKGAADGKRLLLAEGLNRPHGLALHDGFLYLAETNTVLRIAYDSQQQKFSGKPVSLIKNSFPSGGNHWTRTVKISPDNKLFVSVGSSCNVCIERSSMRASIIQYELDGSKPALYAEGLRNTVGFDWHPVNHLMYGVDNGRDLLGDDMPPEELNQINQGQHYGWPFYYGNNDIDTAFSKPLPTRLTPMPAQHFFTAHSAPLSLLFLRHNPRLPNTALVTLHGSWNRSKKSGYKVVAVSFLADGSIEQTDFLSGFLQPNGRVLGRPVDLVEDKAGNIYISDDYAGRIYKATPNNP
ncbi:MAG: PQQ-dependent sugar dehydrogenase [Cycloclasticus sp.]|nr:PQQ-dependent sugar dehydrogenase [Cycloclasticus sp.]MBQ0789050.1 PQQ-dependent sugar dehydrogenase [Cycloclasticus sp.]